MNRLDDKLLRVIMLAARNRNPMWVFRLRKVCRRFREMFDVLLTKEGAVILTAAIQHSLRRTILLQHNMCLADYTTKMSKHLLKIASEAKTADELCEQLTNVAADVERAPTLQKLLITAAANVVSSDKQWCKLRWLQPAEDIEDDEPPPAHNPLKVEDVCEQVRKIASNVMGWRGGRRNRRELFRKSADAAEALVCRINDAAKTSDSETSTIVWVAQNESFYFESPKARHCVPMPLRLLCVRWLQAKERLHPTNFSEMQLGSVAKLESLIALHRTCTFNCSSPDCGYWVRLQHGYSSRRG